MKCGVTRKRYFKSHQAAMIRAGELLMKDTKGTQFFRTYKCEYCGGYHLTTK